MVVKRLGAATWRMNLPWRRKIKQSELQNTISERVGHIPLGKLFQNKIYALIGFSIQISSLYDLIQILITNCPEIYRLNQILITNCPVLITNCPVFSSKQMYFNY